MDYIEQLKRSGNNIYPNTVDKAVLDSNGTPLDVRLAVLEEMIEGMSHQDLVHEVEVWADYECTTRPTGEVDHVYVQLNRDFKFNESTEYGDSSSESTNCFIGTDAPDGTGVPIGDSYIINLWTNSQEAYMFMSVDQYSYFTAGQVLLCKYVASPSAYPFVNVTGYQTSFGALIPKPEIQRYRGVITNVSNVPLPTLLVGYSKFAVNCKKDYDGELNEKLGPAYVYCLEQANESIYIPIGRVLIGKQERKNLSSEDSAYAWRTLVIKRQSGNYNFALGIHPDECSEGYGTYDILEEGSVIYSTGNTWIYVINVLLEGEYEFNIEAIEIYDFKEEYPVEIVNLPSLPTPIGNLNNTVIDTTGLGELSAIQLMSLLDLYVNNTKLGLKTNNNDILIDNGNLGYIHKLESNSKRWIFRTSIPSSADTILVTKFEFVNRYMIYISGTTSDNFKINTEGIGELTASELESKITVLKNGNPISRDSGDSNTLVYGTPGGGAPDLIITRQSSYIWGISYGNLQNIEVVVNEDGDMTPYYVPIYNDGREE